MWLRRQSGQGRPGSSARSTFGNVARIAIAPVNTIADVVQDVQLAANGYFERQFDSVLGKALVFPGPPYRLSRTPAQWRGKAPALGEHNAELIHLSK